METVIHRIRDLARNKRSAAEQLVGHELREDQQLVIQVVNVDSCDSVAQSASPPQPSVQAWLNIYEGLSDERIDELDQAIRQRANLTRTFE